MVNDSRAQSHRLVPGGVVLSPWQPELMRYGPGRVIEATERRAEGVTHLQVLMWTGCVSLVPDSLVLPISASHFDRLVRELRVPPSAPDRCSSWLRTHEPTCTPRLSYTDCCQSAFTSCCCSVTHHQPSAAPPSCRSGLGESDMVEANVRKGDSEETPSSTSSVSTDETTESVSPAVGLRSKQKRPPWKYWRRIGPEPQHRQPGTTRPASFPVPQTSASPNHSSLFQSLPATKGRRANIRDVFGTANFKPRPPAGLRSSSGNNVTTAYTAQKS
ncbi:uncharacterized protein C11orf16 homolog [Odontesthes bonariensis]|uniref:uncharacterized protein C11orf16 homolog n=1 Tax=Odontesthes bonariensis TaxID=219752 RepID=UPI003F58195D